jgi:clan AA aspartic protease
MMQGWVNQNCEAMLPIVVGHGNAPKQMVEALIDTGFPGFLSLPLSIIESLGLPWIFSDSVTLGDGSEAIFQMYQATVIWDGLSGSGCGSIRIRAASRHELAVWLEAPS